MREGRELAVTDWGVLDYGRALDRQRSLVQVRLANRVPDTLVLVEHPPVVTAGRGNGQGDLRLSREALRRRGVDFQPSDRGGKTTYHGPGQLVAYPIIKLRNRDVPSYVQALLGVVAGVVQDYGLQPEYVQGRPGLWLRGRKVASIGVAVKQGVSYHGVALNVNNDLAPFGWIIPCGHTGARFTSLAEALGKALAMAEVKRRFVHEFCQAFGYWQPTAGERPPWLRLPPPQACEMMAMQRLLAESRLNTVCQSAHCPNLGECFARGTATFLILGDRCTRGCRFCAVKKGAPQAPDPGEPRRVAQAVRELGLKYVVVTSVTRDDLPDGGAGQFVRTMEAVRRFCPGVRIEVLVPDFQGAEDALGRVCRARPEVFNHNLETVPRLYDQLKPQADYGRAIRVLVKAKAYGLKLKSGLMLGLGETDREIRQTLRDLRQTGCQYLTLGQYLSPSPAHAPVVRYLPPEKFAQWEREGLAMGFNAVAAGPLVRSSYQAERMYSSPDNALAGARRQALGATAETSCRASGVESHCAHHHRSRR